MLGGETRCARVVMPLRAGFRIQKLPGSYDLFRAYITVIPSLWGMAQLYSFVSPSGKCFL